jgi:hypothetical protein
MSVHYCKTNEDFYGNQLQHETPTLALLSKKAREKQETTKADVKGYTVKREKMTASELMRHVDGIPKQIATVVSGEPVEQRFTLEIKVIYEKEEV